MNATKLAVKGLRGLQKKLNRMQKDRHKVVTRGLTAGAAVAVKGMKRRANVETGELKKWEKSKIKKYRGGEQQVAIIGPAKKDAAKEAAKYAKRVSVATAKGRKTPAKPSNRNPARYGHLVEKGHRIVDKHGLTRGQVAGSHFIERTMHEDKDAIQIAISAGCAAELQKQGRG